MLRKRKVRLHDDSVQLLLRNGLMRLRFELCLRRLLQRLLQQVVLRISRNETNAFDELGLLGALFVESGYCERSFPLEPETKHRRRLLPPES
ncbi:MAG: hypothetical protein AAF670_08650 [Planctomycetota bacterium]